MKTYPSCNLTNISSKPQTNYFCVIQNFYYLLLVVKSFYIPSYHVLTLYEIHILNSFTNISTHLAINFPISIAMYHSLYVSTEKIIKQTRSWNSFFTSHLLFTFQIPISYNGKCFLVYISFNNSSKIRFHMAVKLHMLTSF